MKRFALFLFFLSVHFIVFSQSAPLPNDCVNALVVCGNGNFNSNAIGIGDRQEIGACGGREINSIWLKINIVRNGTLGFNLIPNDPSLSVDYDFWVFGRSNITCNNLGSPIRCSTTNPEQAGLTSNVTGMNGSTNETAAGPGALGNGFVRWLDVQAGQTYFIAIDRPSGDGGFELQWIGSTIDNGGAFAPPPIANSIPELRTCSATSEIGFFDLNTVRTQINSDTNNNTITYHKTLADAVDGIAPLPDLYANITNPQEIYTKVTNNTTGCSSISSFMLRVLPTPNAAITVPESVCRNTNATIRFEGTPNAVVEYRENGGSIQKATLNNEGVHEFSTLITVTTTFLLEKVRRLASDNQTTICSENPNVSVTINVIDLPSVSISGTTSVCSGDTTLISFLGTPNATVSYSVNGGDNQTIILDSEGKAELISPPLIIDTSYALVNVVDLNCSNAALGVVSITVVPLPIATISASSICNQTSGIVSFSGTPEAEVTYRIDGGADQVIALDASGMALVTTPILTSNSTYELVNVRSTISNCNQLLSMVATVVVLPTPDVIMTPSTTAICSGTTVEINLSSSVLGTTFSWTVLSQTNAIGAVAGAGSVISNLLSTTSSANGSVVFLVTPIANGCEGFPTPIQVDVTALPLVNVSNLAPSLCSGEMSNIELSSNIEGATFSWVVLSGNEIGANGGSGTNIYQTLTLNSATTTPVDVIYEVVAFANSCYGMPEQIHVTVNPLPEVIISNNFPIICSGELLDISFTSNVNGAIFNWEVLSVNGVSGAVAGEGINLQQLLAVTGTTQGSVTYQVTPNFMGCDGFSKNIIVLVDPIPELIVNSSHPPLCSGEFTQINLSSFTAASSYEWIIDSEGVEGAFSGSQSGLLSIIEQKLSTTGNVEGYVDYTIISKLGNCYGEPKVVRVNVNPLPQPNLLDGNICVDINGNTLQEYTLDSGLYTDQYDFVWFYEGIEIPDSNNFFKTVNELGTYSVIAKNRLTLCESENVSATVKAFLPASSFSVIQSAYFSDSVMLTIAVVGGSGSLLYQIDNGPFQESNIFKNVVPGTHIINVIDSEGCTFLEQTITIIDYPRYFTPNGDGINDEWFIAGMQVSDIIYIYDRYGKLIKQLHGEEKWDGTFNQHPLPSTDYWFTVDYFEEGERKQFKSHFAMKR